MIATKEGAGHVSSYRYVKMRVPPELHDQEHDEQDSAAYRKERAYPKKGQEANSVKVFHR